MPRRVGAGFDAGTLRELNRVFAVAFEDSAKHLSRPPSDAYLRRLLAQSQFIAVAAIEAQTTGHTQVVGGLIAYQLEKIEQETSEIYLYDLAVAEPFRRRGIARELIGKLREVAHGLRAKVIFVQADREDLPAIELYKSLSVPGAEPEEPFHFDIEVM
jgi:aminoglycoside 3-N-acetyltransferase I